MNIQLALDRMTIPEAIQLTHVVREHIDWIEVGTSLIKEFGMESVQKLKEAFPEKIIVADMKTMDNATYEFEMCFHAGADVATVMGVAPHVSIETCMEAASKMNKKVMIDLLGTTNEQINALAVYKDAIFCAHVSKDQQELTGKRNQSLNLPSKLLNDSSLELAAAGGITIDSLKDFKDACLSVAIVGSAITKADDPAAAACAFKEVITTIKGEKML
ncbi:3-hexulose-6-phosphate synthase [Bacillus taeanensis]|uniref:3-hexulose-6-phosphate synthase n=1 Tax=Bacillus taeanensis TaxID=273032 RepID=A0A366XSE2_9BACI|nr:3-hexulose-6-phosphate synthase [Bacillus taeanensis]RBW68468.1 3-hexulose-6-phosphate synthase [Bacillus taeanensis]